MEGLVNLSKVLIGPVLVQFWGTCVLFINTQNHAPNLFLAFLSPGYVLPVVGP